MCAKPFVTMARSRPIRLAYSLILGKCCQLFSEVDNPLCCKKYILLASIATTKRSFSSFRLLKTHPGSTVTQYHLYILMPAVFRP